MLMNCGGHGFIWIANYAVCANFWVW